MAKIARQIRKPRFSEAQTAVLEEVFAVQAFPHKLERGDIVYRTGLTDSQIRVWFQNRRVRAPERIQRQFKSSRPLRTVTSRISRRKIVDLSLHIRTPQQLSTIKEEEVTPHACNSQDVTTAQIRDDRPLVNVAPVNNNNIINSNNKQPTPRRSSKPSSRVQFYIPEKDTDDDSLTNRERVFRIMSQCNNALAASLSVVLPDEALESSCPITDVCRSATSQDDGDVRLMRAVKLMMTHLPQPSTLSTFKKC